MPLVSFSELMAEAERGHYAVGYFETWNLESFLAVADAAESVKSPVLIGFSGIFYLPNPKRLVSDPLSVYAALAVEACKQLSVPSCTVFNESPHLDWVLRAIDLGFGLVMFTDESLSLEEQSERVLRVVREAHRASVAVEGELAPLPDVGGSREEPPEDLRLTDPQLARAFVEFTGIDALAVNIGQAHLHGRAQLRLNFSRLVELKKTAGMPLVLHGGSSISRLDLTEAIRLGIWKINVGSILKRSYFEAIRDACARVGDSYNPYEVVGSGLDPDVLTAGRSAVLRGSLFQELPGRQLDPAGGDGGTGPDGPVHSLPVESEDDLRLSAC